VIRFESTVIDGLIKIPEQYIDEIPDPVIVILAEKETCELGYRPKTKPWPKAIEELGRLGLDTSGWKFSRDEANER
jgi:hypothetical protein